MSNKSPQSIQWRQAKIEQIKLAIKVELDSSFDRKHPDRRLDLALSQIQACQEVDSSENRLRCFVYVVSALVHHVRFGGLREAQINRLAHLAESILRIQGITTSESSLGFLHSELTVILGQIYRKAGDPWRAAWMQFLSVSLSRQESDVARGFQALANGNRALRLGNIPLALLEFERAESGPIAPINRAECRLIRVRTLRLSGDFKGAEKLSNEMRQWEKLSPEFILELDWEKLCRSAQQSGDIRSLIHNVRPGKKHSDIHYLIEAHLWGKTSSCKDLSDKLPSIENALRRFGDRLGDLELAYRFAVQLQRCHDDNRPVRIRASQLGKLMSNTRKLISLDHELLVWAASARWLSQHKFYELANLVLSEYRWMSERITDKKTGDALGVVSDLFEKNWFILPKSAA